MKYKCRICGYIHDEEKEGIAVADMTKCPVCQQPIENLLPLEEGEEKKEDAGLDMDANLEYDTTILRHDESDRYMEEIHQMAVEGRSIYAAMGTRLPLPKWEDILLLGAQLNPPPLNDEEAVDVQTVIGKHAKNQ